MNDLLDDGMYVATVVKSEVIDSEYMVHKEYNPNGTCLNFWLDVKNHYDENKRLFKRLNKTEVNALLRSFGKPTISSFDDLDATVFDKEDVFVEVQQYKSKAGKLSNIVKKVEKADLDSDKVEF